MFIDPLKRLTRITAALFGSSFEKERLNMADEETAKLASMFEGTKIVGSCALAKLRSDPLAFILRPPKRTTPFFFFFFFFFLPNFLSIFCPGYRSFCWFGACSAAIGSC